MPIEERDPARAGFGAQRLIVRGSRALTAARAAELRAFYNEYPERWPLNPQFPQPGRRGASRPPAATGAEEAAPLPPPPIFPPARARGALDIPSIGGDAQFPTTRGAGQAQACLPPPGGHITHLHAFISNPNRSIKVSARMRFPFLITNIQHIPRGSTNVTDIYTVRVSPNGDTPDDDALTGQLVGGVDGTDSTFQGIGNSLNVVYPNFYVLEPDWYIKTIFRPGSDVNQTTLFNISFTRLDV